MIIGFDDYKDKYNFEDVTGIIHVGAHHGQELESYINTFGSVFIHWFEPLPHVFNILKQNTLHYNKSLLYPFALGDKKETIEMFVDSGNDGQSSSLMKPIGHIEIFPHITFDKKQHVHVKTLDSFCINDSNMLVLDTQGYELKCLLGSVNTLKNIKYVFSEFNTVEMYEGCPTFQELNDFMIHQGFKLREYYYTDGSWGDAFWSKS
jgi:FkbM family methyltransferase